MIPKQPIATEISNPANEKQFGISRIVQNNMEPNMVSPASTIYLATESFHPGRDFFE